MHRQVRLVQPLILLTDLICNNDYNYCCDSYPSWDLFPWAPEIVRRENVTSLERRFCKGTVVFFYLCKSFKWKTNKRSSNLGMWQQKRGIQCCHKRRARTVTKQRSRRIHGQNLFCLHAKSVQIKTKQQEGRWRYLGKTVQQDCIWQTQQVFNNSTLTLQAVCPVDGKVQCSLS